MCLICWATTCGRSFTAARGPSAPKGNQVEIARDVGPYFEFCLEMECAAAEPYLRFVYDEYEHALASQRFLAEQGLLECSPPHGRVLVEGGEPLGAVSGLPGAELRKLRMKAAIALARHPSLRLDDAARRRLKLARCALFPPEDTDFYSSKLGVSPKARNRGIGETLMRLMNDEGQAGGFRRVIGEIAPNNSAMVRLMTEKVGWVVLDTSRAEDRETGRVLEYHHIYWDCRKG